ncbi:hypothetical protein D4R71_02825 [bacterium]|nr:MAG: hypothetical protein D4R71_02825 [bacterium]
MHKKMIESKNSFEKYIKRNRVFILGAGFSVGAGIPLTSTLLDQAMKKFSIECPGLFKRVDGYARESIERYDEMELNYSEVDFSGLCTFLEYIELREYAGGERWKDEGSREKLSLKYYLAKTIAENTPSVNEIPQMYIDFANELHDRDIVISFNWDGLLEIALKNVGKFYTYNWVDDSAITLCKLHGSVNWRLNEPNHLGKPVNTLNWESLNLMKGMMDVEIYYTPELLNYDTWYYYSPLGEVEPFLVLPGYGKAFDVRSNAAFWYKPEIAFANTHDIYIIGLSLTPDDFFIRSLFLSSLPYIGSYSEVKGRKIFIINPDENASKNYNFVLSRGNADLINEKFSIEHVNFIRGRRENA